MKKLGILGSGQLALYLCQAAKKHSIHTLVFAKKEDDSASAEASEIILEDKFLDSINCFEQLTFENEFFSNEYLEFLKLNNIAIYPNARAIELLKNKYRQKELFAEQYIESSPFKRILRIEDIEEPSKKLVLKYGHGAYDGKGLLVLNNDFSEVNDFLDRANEKNIEVYQEKFVSFDKELAIQCAFRNGKAVYEYPLVETVQENGICKWVQPFPHGNKTLRNEALTNARIIAQELNYTGVLAIEYFYQEAKDKLIVNEVAPRVHNSGHYTLDAFNVSQFEAHILMGNENQKLPSLEKKQDVLMLNLVSPISAILPSSKIEVELPENSKLYWYGKKEMKPGRKVGHLNYLLGEGESWNDVKARLLEWEEKLWQKLQ